MRVWSYNKLLKQIIRQTEDTGLKVFLDSDHIKGWKASMKTAFTLWPKEVTSKRLTRRFCVEQAVTKLNTCLPIAHVYSHTYIKCNLKKARVSVMCQANVKAADVYNCITCDLLP